MVNFDFDFNKLFAETKGQPIKYKGFTLWKSDNFPIGKKTKIRVIFESVNSKWRQGISLSTDKGIKVKGKFFKRGFGIWRDTAPDVTECICYSKNGVLRVWNVWDTGDGVVESRHYGAAMIVEQLPNGRRYRCNDGYPDDDFDDLIFRIEVVEDKE
jgi:hypothetical protein